ncbi:MAG: class I SAM-dependent methyltransferase [Deltaproteobacteria bacterium]|nr:class I SAM-dependent methyltransferase [Deltaproteobacteria bacterium]
MGFLASHLARQHELNVTGIDLDPDQVARARNSSGRAMGPINAIL